MEHRYSMRVGRDTYELQFSNRGHREAEDFLQESGDALQEKVAMGQMSHRILTAVMFGATRKHHRRELPGIDEIDALMDEIEEEYEDAGRDAMTDNVIIPLMSAYLRQSPERMKRMANGEDIEDEENEDEDEGGKPTKDQDKPTRKPKPKPKAVKDASTGGSSSGPESEAV